MEECLDLFLVPTYPTCLTYALEWVTGGGAEMEVGAAGRDLAPPPSQCVYLLVLILLCPEHAF